MEKYGPEIPIAEWVDVTKYRQPGETFTQKCGRIAGALSDNQDHYDKFYQLLKEQKFLPGGRIQAAVGSAKRVTAFNCFVMPKVPDDFLGIMKVMTEGGQTLRMGGGTGDDFSDLRPRGDPIKSLGSQASGPVSFMQIADAVCATIASAGHRRGARMATLRVDHPDIMEFVTAKNNEYNLRNFNTSVLVTDKFMEAVKVDGDFDLVFQGKVYQTIKARNLWDTILRNTWDWAEPGVIFIDRVNEMNNLWYCEDISATNPCGEQPLPPYGACLLGSVNLVKYVYEDLANFWWFDYHSFTKDIRPIVRAMDNVIDETTYPLPQQEVEAKNKRRMGLGITGLADVLARLDIVYGSFDAKFFLSELLMLMADEVYYQSAMLAKEKGPFPLYSREEYLESKYIQQLSPYVRNAIAKYGIRNSHLMSIAPTGTISLYANNVSSGIEPVFAHSYTRKVNKPDGFEEEVVEDYAVRVWGLKPITADKVSVEDHIGMLTAAQKWVDSAVSKTCNVGPEVTWDQFKSIYMQAYDGGAKGCTTFRSSGKRAGILTASASEDTVQEDEKKGETVVEGAACYIDPETGIRSCE